MRQRLAHAPAGPPAQVQIAFWLLVAEALHNRIVTAIDVGSVSIAVAKLALPAGNLGLALGIRAGRSQARVLVSLVVVLVVGFGVLTLVKTDLKSVPAWSLLSFAVNLVILLVVVMVVYARLGQFAAVRAAP